MPTPPAFLPIFPLVRHSRRKPQLRRHKQAPNTNWLRYYLDLFTRRVKILNLGKRQSNRAVPAGQIVHMMGRQGTGRGIGKERLVHGGYVDPRKLQKQLRIVMERNGRRPETYSILSQAGFYVIRTDEELTEDEWKEIERESTLRPRPIAPICGPTETDHSRPARQSRPSSIRASGIVHNTLDGDMSPEAVKTSETSDSRHPSESLLKRTRRTWSWRSLRRSPAGMA
ncbi:hypothetical protein F4780DRAFT_737942 [Xylariomycetidae sp. FL0641]|nr:hypothetical protein F4780DRAFT_737942 [Xylariomycetidae sp. FL0641]